MYVSTFDIYESVTENQILPWYYQLDLKFLEDGLCIGSVYRFMAGFIILLIPILAIPILPLALILIISVICAIQIIIDLRYHPHHRIF